MIGRLATPRVIGLVSLERDSAMPDRSWDLAVPL